MSNPATARLQDYPFATVRLVCGRCDQQVRRTKTALIAAHGPETTMLNLRRLIFECGRPLKPGASCDAYFPDLIAG